MEHILACKPMENQELYGTYIYGDRGYKPMIIHYKAGRGRDIKLKNMIILEMFHWEKFEIK